MAATLSEDASFTPSDWAKTAAVAPSATLSTMAHLGLLRVDNTENGCGGCSQSQTQGGKGEVGLQGAVLLCCHPSWEPQSADWSTILLVLWCTIAQASQACSLYVLNTVVTITIWREIGVQIAPAPWQSSKTPWSCLRRDRNVDCRYDLLISFWEGIVHIVGTCMHYLIHIWVLTRQYYKYTYLFTEVEWSKIRVN